MRGLVFTWKVISLLLLPFPLHSLWSAFSWISDTSHTKSLWVSSLWDSQGAWGLAQDLEWSGCCSLFVRNPELQGQMLLFPGFLIRGPLAAGAGYHLLSPILVTFLQLYCCLSELLGLHSSWSCTPAGFELVMAVKTSLKVWCWLAATFCWMCVWRLSICWHHHAFTGSLCLFALQMLCWFPLPRSSRSFGTKICFVFPIACAIAVGRGVCVHVHPRLW